MRLAATRSLKYPPVRFNGVQALVIGRGFGELVAEIGLAVWACAILPDHLHLVVGPHFQPADVLAARFKMAATGRLKQEGLHPFGHLAEPSGSVPKCWQRGEWKVFLFDEAAVQREIKYVEENPLKEGKPKQNWSFVVPYTG